MKFIGGFTRFLSIKWWRLKPEKVSLILSLRSSSYNIENKSEEMEPREGTKVL